LGLPDGRRKMARDGFWQGTSVLGGCKKLAQKAFRKGRAVFGSGHREGGQGTFFREMWAGAQPGDRCGGGDGPEYSGGGNCPRVGATSSRAGTRRGPWPMFGGPAIGIVEGRPKTRCGLVSRSGGRGGFLFRGFHGGGKGPGIRRQKPHPAGPTQPKAGRHAILSILKPHFGRGELRGGGGGAGERGTRFDPGVRSATGKNLKKWGERWGFGEGVRRGNSRENRSGTFGMNTSPRMGKKKRRGGRERAPASPPKKAHRRGSSCGHGWETPTDCGLILYSGNEFARWQVRDSPEVGT